MKQTMHRMSLCIVRNFNPIYTVFILFIGLNPYILLGNEKFSDSQSKYSNNVLCRSGKITFSFIARGFFFFSILKPTACCYKILYYLTTVSAQKQSQKFVGTNIDDL